MRVIGGLCQQQQISVVEAGGALRVAFLVLVFAFEGDAVEGLALRVLVPPDGGADRVDVTFETGFLVLLDMVFPFVVVSLRDCID